MKFTKEKNMVKNLQRKFVRSVMLSLLLVLILVEGVTNGIYIHQMKEKSQNLMDMLINNDGVFREPEEKPEEKPETKPGEKREEKPKEKSEKKPKRNGVLGFPMSEETPFETRYFSVLVSESGEMQMNLEHIAAVSEEQAKAFVEEIEEKGRECGYKRYYRYQVKEAEEGRLYIFVDRKNDLDTIRNFLIASILVGFGCMGLAFGLVIPLSGWAVRPILKSIERQKQFITDAGHEIKTPLAIISANAEVIEMCDGESEWTRSIHNQVNRLDELLKNLLMLAKMEESKGRLNITECDVSALLEIAATDFGVLLERRHLHLKKEVQEFLIVRADKNSLYNLVSILLDNAVKYTPEGGNVRIEGKQKEGRVELSFYNDCDELPPGDLNRLFDRFYRFDESRSRENGGYGMGLSIAYSIVEAHKWKVTVKRMKKGICFNFFMES